MNVEQESKVCPKCGKRKPLSEFTKDRSKSDGLETYCRDCKRAYSAFRYQRDHEKIRQSAKEYNQRPEVKKRKQAYEQLPEVRARRKQQKRSPEAQQRRREQRKTPEAKRKQKEKDRERNQNPKNRDKHRLQVMRYALEHPEWLFVQRAKARAKRKSAPFSLTPKDIVIPSICPILGIPLEQNEKEIDDGSPSVDEIIPGLGYVVGNVAIISHKANSIKSDGTAEEHRKIADWMENWHSEQTGRPALTKKEKRVVQSAKQRAKKKGLEFCLSLDEVKFPEYCPVFGVKLTEGTRQDHQNSPSLDRVDSGKGYTIDNVAIISHRANFVKNRGTAEEHRRIADWMDQFAEKHTNCLETLGEKKC